MTSIQSQRTSIKLSDESSGTILTGYTSSDCKIRKRSIAFYISERRDTAINALKINSYGFTVSVKVSLKCMINIRRRHSIQTYAVFKPDICIIETIEFGGVLSCIAKRDPVFIITDQIRIINTAASPEIYLYVYLFRHGTVIFALALHFTKIFLIFGDNIIINLFPVRISQGKFKIPAFFQFFLTLIYPKVNDAVLIYTIFISDLICKSKINPVCLTVH